MKVKEILMTKPAGVITILEDDTIQNAMRLLAARRIGAVVVVDQDDKPVGILSERDIVREAAAQGAEVFPQPVSSIMTRNLIIALPEDEVTYLTHTMTDRRIRHLPVVEDGKLIGIVTIGDVVKAQMAHYEGEIHHLRFYLAEAE